MIARVAPSVTVMWQGFLSLARSGEAGAAFAARLTRTVSGVTRRPATTKYLLTRADPPRYWRQLYRQRRRSK